jgi:hemin uptake protein HemP
MNGPLEVALDRGRGTAAGQPAPERIHPGTDGIAVDTAERIRTVTSAELLGARGIVGIEHNGQLYTLRRTRHGRLILTK